MSQTLRVGLYARISDAEDSLGVQRQLRQLRGSTVPQHYWLPRFKLTAHIVGEYVDNDRSAYDEHLVREEWERLLIDVRAARLDAIAVYSLDRLFRQPYDFEVLRKAMNTGGARFILSETHDDVDMVSGEGVMMARLQGIVGFEEAAKTQRRIRFKHTELAENGRPSGGPRRFGYEVDRMTVRQEEAEVIREVAARLLSGTSLHSIAQDLNARGIRPAGVSRTERENVIRAAAGEELVKEAPSRWVNANLGRMMQRPYLAGIREHHGTLYPAAWPAILDQGTHDLIRAALSAPGRSTAPRGIREDRYELTGLLRCGRCGSKMYRVPVMEPPVTGRAHAHGQGKAAHRGATAWVCHRTNGGCGRVSRRPDPTEGWIIRELVARLTRPDVLVGHDQAAPGLTERAEVLSDLRAAQALREEAQVAYYAPAPGAPRLPKHVYERIDTEHGARVDALENKLTALSTAAGVNLTHLADPETLPDRWPGISIADRRGLLRLVVDHVRVLPAGKGSKVGMEHYEVIYVR